VFVVDIVPSVGSTEIRSPRPAQVKFHVGQVVRHKRFGYRGVIIGWDVAAKVSLSVAACLQEPALAVYS